MATSIVCRCSPGSCSSNFSMTWNRSARRRSRPCREEVSPCHRAALSLARLGRQPKGITGDELLAFINQDEAMRPDGKRGRWSLRLSARLQGVNGGNRRDVIATVFKGVDNRMKSGYLLRDVINKVGGIHFTSSDEIHTLGHLYESMLREMRDAAGDSGEFYTPRPVVRFMVEVTDRALARPCSTPPAARAGFSWRRSPISTSSARPSQTAECSQTGDALRRGSQSRCPICCAQMNLLLHGLEAPQIDPGNACAFQLSEIGDKDRVDVILTNPPFGGEEERGILSQLSRGQPDRRDRAALPATHHAEAQTPAAYAGAALRSSCRMARSSAMAFAPASRKSLLKEFNLHTIVRLPNGVFAPYTSIPTNLLFFDRSGPTKEVWYYEQPLPEGRKKYTKTQPIQFDEFKACMAWWKKREENEHAWKVPLVKF